MTHPPAPLTERRYVLPLVLVTSLFFLWAIGVNLNDVLIPHLKKAFALTDFQSSFIQVAFFGGYFLGALPACWLMEKIGYKGGILVGLLICAVGALLFIPASIIGAYGLFLFALFVMSSGQSFLEVGANPYVTVLGPSESSERRLNFAQSFNAVGAVVTPALGAMFILSGIEYAPAQLAAMNSQQLAAYRHHEASMVKVPYVVITGIFLLVAALIYSAHLPEVAPDETQAGTGDSRKGSQTIWALSQLIKSINAPFFFGGAQVGLGIRASGVVPVASIVMFGFCNSSMLPTIFALSLKNLGPLTKRGSSLLVMSIIGGALIPAAMGRISDLSTIQVAFIVPLICYVYVFYFAKWGFRPVAPGAAN